MFIDCADGTLVILDIRAAVVSTTLMHNEVSAIHFRIVDIDAAPHMCGRLSMTDTILVVIRNRLATAEAKKKRATHGYCSHLKRANTTNFNS